MAHNPINGNLSEQDNAAPFMCSPAAAPLPFRRPRRVPGAGFEEYADKLLDLSQPVAGKYLPVSRTVDGQRDALAWCGLMVRVCLRRLTCVWAFIWLFIDEGILKPPAKKKKKKKKASLQGHFLVANRSFLVFPRVSSRRRVCAVPV